MQDLITDELILASPQAALCENETESICCQVLLEEGAEGSEQREKGQGGVVALHVRFSPEMDGGGVQGSGNGPIACWELIEPESTSHLNK
jgi:hypothetical protein